MSYVDAILAQTDEVASQCLKTAEDIASTLINLRVPGHRPIDVDTDVLSMHLEKDFIDRMSGTTFHLSRAKSGGRGVEVKLPDIAGNSTASAERVLGIQVGMILIQIMSFSDDWWFTCNYYSVTSFCSLSIVMMTTISMSGNWCCRTMILNIGHRPSLKDVVKISFSHCCICGCYYHQHKNRVRISRSSSHITFFSFILFPLLHRVDG